MTDSANNDYKIHLIDSLLDCCAFLSCTSLIPDISVLIIFWVGHALFLALGFPFGKKIVLAYKIIYITWSCKWQTSLIDVLLIYFIETTVSVSRLIVSGTLDEIPRLKVTAFTFFKTIYNRFRDLPKNMLVKDVLFVHIVTC